jgi:hypothetical protein
MGAKRTIDPNNSVAGLAFIGARLSTIQLEQLDKLCQHHGMSRSSVIRCLISWEIERLGLNNESR